MARFRDISQPIDAGRGDPERDKSIKFIAWLVFAALLIVFVVVMLSFTGRDEQEQPTPQPSDHQSSLLSFTTGVVERSDPGSSIGA